VDHGRVLVTGAAGFIGAAVVARLLDEGREVVGVDDLNDYYSPRLKRARLARLEGRPGWRFVQASLEDGEDLAALFAQERPRAVVNLAAQAGVRYSLLNPAAYIQSNIVGFGHILEGCRHHGVRHLAYASSSSVYGLNESMPFSTSDNVDHPVSLYAASKKSNELMAHTYSHLYGLPTTGLRFFTVYGPWGRPDMALFLFTKAMLAGESIQVFNHGRMVRDFTYIDDIAEGVVRVLDRPAEVDPAYDPVQADPARSNAPYRVFNIGNHNPVTLMAFIEAIEAATGRMAEKNFMPLQDGDVPATHADVSELEAWTGFKPAMPVPQGIGNFVAWYRDYFKA